MPDTVRTVPYHYVRVPNRAGAGAAVLRAVRDAKVNLRAVHGFPDGDESQLDLFPDDAAQLEAAAQQHGITLSARKTAFWIEGDDRVGAMHEVLARLGDAGVNAIASDALRVGNRYAALLWVAPNDLDRAARALGAT